MEKNKEYPDVKIYGHPEEHFEAKLYKQDRDYVNSWAGNKYHQRRFAILAEEI